MTHSVHGMFLCSRASNEKLGDAGADGEFKRKITRGRNNPKVAFGWVEGVTSGYEDQVEVMKKIDLLGDRVVGPTGQKIKQVPSSSLLTSLSQQELSIQIHHHLLVFLSNPTGP